MLRAASTLRLARPLSLLLCAFLVFVSAPPALALDEAHRRKGEEMIEKAIGFLRTQQDQSTGGWMVRPDGPNLPAITGLVVNGMIMSPDVGPKDPAIARATDFILSYRQDDGGIYDRILPSYNTAICLSALSRLHLPEAASAIPPGQDYLRSIQWQEETFVGPDSPRRFAEIMDREHPYYGGVGYGGSGRPDNSNLNLMLQGLHDTGVSSEDPAFRRALVFLERTQMHHDINDMPYAEGSTQGGFIYATSPNDENVGVGESKAGTIEEVAPDGRRISRLRAYGSMTYAGFKSYIYADLDRDDPRVRYAYDWLRRTYTLEENPGIGMDGFYYYLLTMSRALDAWGLDEIVLLNENDEVIGTADWANDLIDRLGELQEQDGSFRVVDERWMEGNEVLITAYALIALQHAVR